MVWKVNSLRSSLSDEPWRQRRVVGMSQTFRRALSNSGRDGKFWDIRNIVPSRGLICSFWFSRKLHLPSHHVRTSAHPIGLDPLEAAKAWMLQAKLKQAWCSQCAVVGQASEPLSLLRSASTCSNTRHTTATLALQDMHTAIVVASRS